MAAADLGAPGAIPQSSALAAGTHSTNYKLLCSFADGAESYPGAAPIDVGGTLYGTTQLGGDSNCYAPAGCGTVFSLTP